MFRTLKGISTGVLTLCIIGSCVPKESRFTGAENEVKLVTLDPGHFHAALVQKTMYNQVDPAVHVYAPEGPDVENYLQQVEGYNARADDPTRWEAQVYLGSDYLDKMLNDKLGNVMVTAGNNGKKTAYIKAVVDAGINVLSDKPMCINIEGFALLKEAFASAEENDILLYDIMTERSEINSILQKELSLMPSIFGELEKGSAENPAVTKESVHHFFKYVSGNPIKRPAWYFDTDQQGEGLVDVTTHLIDLVQWGCFPEQSLDYQQDIEILSARRWPTVITPAQFEKVTRLSEFPDYLTKDIGNDGALRVYANGEIIYRLKDVHARVSVVWNYQAPSGGGDTHFSIMRGTKANLVIRQGAEENYKPQLYVEPVGDAGGPDFEGALRDGIDNLAATYPGLGLEQKGDSWWVIIPDEYRIGHEAHFGQVMERYLQYLVDGKLPDWEVPNMLAKYYTTTAALQLARSQ
ncbi:MAG: oxidoreductase [Fidelibacterota bacterium]|nr:MAG: oxidoreductase [Candidatus Neomarinimicrobiota bacterium]